MFLTVFRPILPFFDCFDHFDYMWPLSIVFGILADFDCFFFIVLYHFSPLFTVLLPFLSIFDRFDCLKKNVFDCIWLYLTVFEYILLYLTILTVVDCFWPFLIWMVIFSGNPRQSSANLSNYWNHWKCLEMD